MESSGSSRKSKIHIEVRQADLLTFEGDGIVVPTISEGHMVESIAARVKQASGKTIEEEVLRSAPIAVGAAVVTGGGALPFKHLIHVPVTEEAGMKIGVENIRRATRAGLLAATHVHLESVAIPGFGTGELGVAQDEAARAIIDEIRGYRGTHPVSVCLMDTDPDMVESFQIELGEK
jgi:O-acetyl-ADP-ribose deacetylase